MMMSNEDAFEMSRAHRQMSDQGDTGRGSSTSPAIVVVKIEKRVHALGSTAGLGQRN